ncbi:MAG: HAD family hydrolase [Betaproteobacteria bacterium]
MKSNSLALFDLDHTLIPIDSDQSWGRFTTEMGVTDAGEFLKTNEAFYQDYCREELDIAAYVRFTTQAARLMGPQKAQALRTRYMQEVIQPHILSQALDLVNAHRERGDHLMIVTATNEWVTRPIADCFGIEDLIAVELQTDATGWITGEIKGIPSLGEGKLKRVEQWLKAKGLHLSELDTTFYSDSINDLPLMKSVKHPVATNPDERLKALAIEKAWPILDLFGQA